MKWEPIETAPLDGTEVDLFGFIKYNKTEVRLVFCEYVNGEWLYFTCGGMHKIAELCFTPTHWMKVENPNEV